MNLVPLGEFMPSKIPSVNPAKFPDETFELWSIPAFDAGKPEVLLGSNIGSSKKCIEPGDVLLSRIVPHIRRSCVVPPRTSNRQIASGEWITFRGNAFDPNYLRQILVSDPFNAEFMQTVAGVGGSLLRARPEGVKQIKIPLPPLEEQKRIAGILDQADALRRLRTRALDKLNTLGQAIFHEMFGDLLKNDKQWATEPISSVCSAMVDCVNRTAPLSEAPTDFRMIRTTNVRNGRINLETTRFVDEDTFAKWNRRLVPKPGDVILTREAPVGEVGVLLEGGVFLGQRLFLYRPNENKITADFLSYQMQSNFFTQQFGQFGSGSTVKHLPLPACQGFEVRVPPIILQNEFSEKLCECERQLGFCKRGGQESESLFAALQHRAFRGEL